MKRDKEREDELLKYAETHSYEDILRNNDCFKDEDVDFMMQCKFILDDIFEISENTEDNDLEITDYTKEENIIRLNYKVNEPITFYLDADVTNTTNEEEAKEIILAVNQADNSKAFKILEAINLRNKILESLLKQIYRGRI